MKYRHESRPAYEYLIYMMMRWDIISNDDDDDDKTTKFYGN